MLLLLYCTILYCTTLYHIILHFTVLHCIVLYYIILYCNCATLYSTVLHCTPPHRPVLYFTVYFIQEFNPEDFYNDLQATEVRSDELEAYVRSRLNVNSEQTSPKQAASSESQVYFIVFV